MWQFSIYQVLLIKEYFSTMQFRAGVKTLEGETGLYEVFCGLCDAPIGAMRLRQVRDAIFATFHRGGILCPSCRKITCDVCGKSFLQGSLGLLDGPSGEIRSCLDCAVAISDTLDLMGWPALGSR